MQSTPLQVGIAEAASPSLRQRNNTHGGGPAQAVAEHRLLLLPPTVLGHVWPAERVVLGLRVCKQLRQDLLVHCGSIVLVQQKRGAELSVVGCTEDFRRLQQHMMVSLRWRERNGAAKLAGLLGNCNGLVHLDLRRNEIGDEGASLLSAALGECKRLAHLNLKNNDIGPEGAGILS
eukprot:CAMPEP_0177690486 /NCGR_PEP_ID=MMETSP0484_2-20121128/791_1 /TAXON_ID=354590 /ORGANISM="Rhodomonas lens, Strain RHODO" /LENGTH=175 /DNA_ID=CAMNT_0019201031 /DNA_START=33 /DNA_END=556 /DNA_ORIENTATION=-